MGRPPKKPHFFTFVCSEPSSRNGAVIPKSFICKYLKGERLESALLKRGSLSWAVELGDVKINGETAQIFANGWDKFEKDNGLKTGDFIVFMLEGNLVFEILVFGPTLCEREFSPSTSIDGMRKKSPPKGTTSKEPTTNIHGADQKTKPVKILSKASQSASKANQFSVTLKPNNITRSYLVIPNKFARLYKLSNGVMILRDGNQRSWTVDLMNMGRYVYISRGWSDFRTANNLNEGDICRFELIENGKKPILNFSHNGVYPDDETPAAAPEPAAECVPRLASHS